MILENLLVIDNPYDLARQEERISKKRAVELYDNGSLDNLQPGTFCSLQYIQSYLFQEIYPFAGNRGR